MKHWVKIGCGLLAGIGAISAQDDLEEAPVPVAVVPGKIEIILKESSLAQFDRDGIELGHLKTGLASLDSLNQQQELLAIEAPQVDPRDSLLRPRLVYVFLFAPDVDVDQLVRLYQQNEHVDAAGPVVAYGTAVRSASWGKVKKNLKAAVPLP